MTVVLILAPIMSIMQRYLKALQMLSSNSPFCSLKSYIICVHLKNKGTHMWSTFTQIADTGCMFRLTGPRGQRCPCGQPWTRTPAQRCLPISENHTHKRFTQAFLAHLWQSRTELKWLHLQSVSGYHSMHKYIQKFKTNVQIIKGALTLLAPTTMVPRNTTLL